MRENLELLLATLWRRRIIRYLIVACAGAVFDISIFSALVFGFRIHYLWAGMVGFVFATGLNYLLSVRFVFSGPGRFPRGIEFLVIYAVSAIGLGWHQLLLYLCVEELHFHVLVSKVVALGLVFFWNYLLRRHFIFMPAAHVRN